MELKIFGRELKDKEYRERPAVYAIIFNEDNNVAVIKTSTGYFLPGGGIEKNEDREQCLHREILEETGYEVEIQDYIGCGIQYLYSATFNCYLKSIGYFYIADMKEKVTDSIEKDHELVWIGPIKSKKYMFLEHQSWSIMKACGLKGIW